MDRVKPGDYPPREYLPQQMDAIVTHLDLLPVHSCNYKNYIKSLAKTDVKTTTKEFIFKSIENHQFPPVSGAESESTCKAQCDDVGINSVYESFLAKEIMLNPGIRIEASKVFKKSFSKMKSYKESLRAWDADNDKTHVLPVTHKHHMESKATELEKGGNPELDLDFFLYNAKALDNIGIGKMEKKKRDKFYHGVLMPNRGKRVSEHNGELRDHYGIAKFDVPELVVPGGDAWQHWGRDTCRLDATSSSFNRKVTQLHLPLVCGISGTTSLALWSALYTKADLSESEVRTYLLSIWSILCVDGGHSLQEVLSASKLVADYLKEEVKKDKMLRKNISLKTLDSLVKATDGINALGDDSSPGKFGAYYDTFFKKFDSDVNFRDARSAAQKEMEKYVEKHCSVE